MKLCLIQRSFNKTHPHWQRSKPEDVRYILSCARDKSPNYSTQTIERRGTLNALFAMMKSFKIRMRICHAILFLADQGPSIIISETSNTLTCGMVFTNVKTFMKRVGTSWEEGFSLTYIGSLYMRRNQSENTCYMDENADTNTSVSVPR